MLTPVQLVHSVAVWPCDCVLGELVWRGDVLLILLIQTHQGILPVCHLHIPVWFQVALRNEFLRKNIGAAHNLVDGCFWWNLLIKIFEVSHVAETRVVVIHGENTELVVLWQLLGFFGLQGTALGRSHIRHRKVWLIQFLLMEWNLYPW